MPERHILAIDYGTQSVRALLFDLQGKLVDKAQVMVTSYTTAQHGWKENEPEAFWTSLCEACQTLWRTTQVPRESVAGVVITTQRGTVINLDKNGAPLRPAIIWMDQRRATRLPKLGWAWDTLFTVIGMQDTIRYFCHEAECNWIAQNQPDIWARTHKYLLLSGYLNYRFTGRFVDSIGSQVAYIPFEQKTQKWAAKNDWKWQALAVKPNMLPELVAAGTTIGQVGEAVARATGILLGTPVVAGAADKACEVLGAGCLTPDVACLSYGTAATINTSTQKYTEPTPMIPPYPSAVPGHYNTEVQISRGYWMVNWFKEQFGLHEQQLGQNSGVPPEHLFDALVNAVPPGSLGLTLQPYWNPGIKIPGPDAKGAIIGFGDVHTRAHLYRAILEGLAYALREGKERIEKRSGQKITRIRISGGGSQSDAAMQLSADIFNLPCERPHLYETSGLGAAMVAAVGLKLHPDYETAVREMTRIGRVFTPVPEHVKTYDALYKRIYSRMYQRLQPLYKAIQEITGYPAK